jgi:hypothetical protein
MSMEVDTPMPETAPPTEPAVPTEPSKYAELMLDLTGENYKYSVRCVRDRKGVYWYCVADFVMVIYKHVLSHNDALAIYIEVMSKLTHDVFFLFPSQIQFKGPLEKPTDCIKMAGLSIVYHFIEKKNHIKEDRRVMFSKVIEDCLNGNEAKHVGLHDDGQIPRLEEAFANGIMDGRFLNGEMDLPESALEFSYANYYTAETAYLLGPQALERVYNKKMAEVKALKDAQEEEVLAVKTEFSKFAKLVKEKEKQIDTLTHANELLVKQVQELELGTQLQERYKKQKGEAFNLRQLVDEMKITITPGQFIILTKAVNLIMKEKYADRQTFVKNKITHFYPSDKRLLELLVTTEMVGVSLADM